MGSPAVTITPDAPVGAPSTGVTITPDAIQAKVSAVHPASDLPGRISDWADRVAADVKYGTDETGIGTVLKKMGAHGVYSGQPEAVGDFMASLPLGLLRMGKGAAQTMNPATGAEGGKNLVGGAAQAATIPGSFVAPEASEAGVNAAGNAARRVADMIPSSDRAGKAFQEVMGAAKTVPVDVSDAGNIALKMHELGKSGFQKPKVITDFLNRVSNPNLPDLTYQEARDFYSAASSKLSPDEMMRIKPQMGYQLRKFTQALGSAIEDAADTVGQRQNYEQAMEEYRKAMQLRDFGSEAWTMAKKAAAASAIGSAAGYGGRLMLERMLP